MGAFRITHHPAPAAHSAAPLHQRSAGDLRLIFARRGERTILARQHQAGALRVLVPRQRTPAPEAIVLNTAGGLTGGDRMAIDVTAEAATTATVTTQAFEKIYRSSGGEAVAATRLSLAPGSRLAWLPQPAIVFDGARLVRSLQVDLAENASLTALEAVVLGRTAMGETVRSGLLRERWRVRRGGRLVFADETRLDGAIAELAERAASLSGAAAFGLLVHLAPDAHRHLDGMRAALASCTGSAAASALDGMIVARFVAGTGAGLVGDLARAVGAVPDLRLPHVWAI